jgi:hypothetical protein
VLARPGRVYPGSDGLSHGAHSTYTGGAGPATLGACTREAALDPATRRACAWPGATEDQCEAAGCCWDNRSATALHCFARSYRDPAASRLAQKTCAVDPARWWECVALAAPAALPAAQGLADRGDPPLPHAQLHARIEDQPSAAAFAPRAPPPTVASLEILLEILPPSAAAPHAAAAAARGGAAPEGLLPLALTMRHPRDELASSALDLVPSHPPPSLVRLCARRTITPRLVRLCARRTITPRALPPTAPRAVASPSAPRRASQVSGLPADFGLETGERVSPPTHTASLSESRGQFDEDNLFGNLTRMIYSASLQIVLAAPGSFVPPRCTLRSR